MDEEQYEEEIEQSRVLQDSDENISNSSKFSKNGCWVYAMIISYGFTSITVSAINPFFPLYMVERDSNNVFAGFIISTVWIPQLIFFPMLCNFALIAGVKTIFVMGNFIFAVTSILFAFLNIIESNLLYLVLGLLVKFVQGIGLAFIKTSAVCIVSRFLSEQSTVILGFLETGSAVGFILGPMIGGVLFDAFGYTISILVPGVCMFVIFFLSMIALNSNSFPKEVTTSEQECDSSQGIEYQLRALCTMKDTYIVAACCFFAFCIPSFYDIVFPMYGTEVAFLRPSTIGFIQLLFAVPDVISSVVSGHLSERSSTGKKIIFGGTFTNTICFLIIFCMGVFNMINYYTLAALIVIQATVTSLMLVPAFKILKELALEKGLPSDKELNVAISNVIIISAMAGQAIGNGSSGLIYESLGIKYSSLLFFLLFSLLLICQIRVVKPKHPMTESTNLI